MDPLISQPTEFVQLDIGGGVIMDAWMSKPNDFDPSRKYPVLVYVYGEPHAQTVLDAWGTVHADYHRLIADLGYRVVSADNGFSWSAPEKTNFPDATNEFFCLRVVSISSRHRKRRPPGYRLLALQMDRRCR
jgi:hypothetical protein